MSKLISDFLEALRALTVLPLPALEKRLPKAAAAGAFFFYPLAGLLIGIATLWFFVLFQSLFEGRISNLILLGLPILAAGGRPLKKFSPVIVFFLLAAKFELLQDLPLKAGSFLFALTGARWAEVFLSFYLPGAVPRAGLRELAGASFFLFLVVVWLAWTGLFIFLGLLVFCGVLLLIFRVRHQVVGAHGRAPLLDAVGEWAELFIYLFVTAAVRP